MATCGVDGESVISTSADVVAVIRLVVAEEDVGLGKSIVLRHRPLSRLQILSFRSLVTAKVKDEGSELRDAIDRTCEGDGELL